LCLKQGSIADLLSGRIAGNSVKHQRFLASGDFGNYLQGGLGDADEVLHFPIQDVSLEFTAGRIDNDLNMVCLFAKFNRSSSMLRMMLVMMDCFGLVPIRAFAPVTASENRHNRKRNDNKNYSHSAN